MDVPSNVNRYADREALSVALTDHIVHLATQASLANDFFSIALSGGSLMDIVGPTLGSASMRDLIDWTNWEVFWADERWVPWSSLDSNYGLAQQQLLSRVDIPSAQVHATDDSLSPSDTARAYESTLANVFQLNAGQIPRFDLVLLGIGEDGHTASLFPEHPVLQEANRWVMPVWDAPKPPPIRITMTLPVINNARNVVIVASGPGKADILAKTLQPSLDTSDLPIRCVNPSKGELQWFVDRAAMPGELRPSKDEP